MAFVVPIVAAIGAGSAATGATILAAAATAAAGGVSAYQSIQAGKATAGEAKLASAAEGDAARQREIDRQRNLLRSISAQEAAAGAAGVSANTGSPNSLINLDIAYANQDRTVDTANTKQQQRALAYRGANAKSAGNSQAFTTLLDTGSRVTGMFLKP
jgi:hypothetical protein